MAAPTYTAAKASTLANDTGGAWTHTTAAPTGAGQFIICHVFQDGVSPAHAITVSGATNVLNLDGSFATFDPLASSDLGYPVGSVGSPTGYHFVYLARSTGTTASVITGANAGSDDIYVRTYQFGNVSTGTTRATVYENGTAGVFASDAGTSASVTDVGVTTLGADRLALNFIAVANATAGAELTAMSGASGGTWAYPVAAAGTATGTDGSLGLVNAAMASAGTINGAADAITSDAWGVVGFALIGTTAGGPTTYTKAGYGKESA